MRAKRSWLMARNLGFLADVEGSMWCSSAKKQQGRHTNQNLEPDLFNFADFGDFLHAVAALFQGVLAEPARPRSLGTLGELWGSISKARKRLPRRKHLHKHGLTDTWPMQMIWVIGGGSVVDEELAGNKWYQILSKREADALVLSRVADPMWARAWAVLTQLARLTTKEKRSRPPCCLDNWCWLSPNNAYSQATRRWSTKVSLSYYI